LPNVGPYIYDVSISGFTRSSIYIYDISSLRVKIGTSVPFTGDHQFVTHICSPKWSAVWLYKDKNATIYTLFLLIKVSVCFICQILRECWQKRLCWVCHWYYS